MQDALSVHRRLLERGVAHEVVRLPRPLQTADELPEVLGLPAVTCAVVRCYVTAPDGEPGSVPTLHAVVVPAGSHPAPQALRDALSAVDIREATSAEINEATDCAARLVTAIGLPEDVPVLVDAALDASGTIWMATGESGTAVAIRGADLQVSTEGRVVEMAESDRTVLDLTALEGRTAREEPGRPLPRRLVDV